MAFSPLLDELIDSFRCLPGVGPKSAQRMAFHLLERHRDKGKKLSDTLAKAITHVGHCQFCRNFSETKLCRICSHPQRDQALLCVVESPSDVLAVEQTASYKGRYFVLMGHLSPLDGIGPEDLGLDRLQKIVSNGSGVEEVILATNPTVEGEATAHYISNMLRKLHTKASRIAHGVPLGGELEYVDGGTLIHAFEGREVI